MIWGFPRWDGKGSIINARSETVTEKSMFRKSFAQSRCVVPTTGFYEWKTIEGQKKKDKYLFRLPDSKVLYLAGIHNEYSQPDGTKRSMFVILTTSANESMQAYHNRMPVMIRPEETADWILGERASEFISRKQPELVATGA
jgi:putative SOS response-associated peptidase YedK